jgi:hypothetical protein
MSNPYLGKLAQLDTTNLNRIISESGIDPILDYSRLFAEKQHLFENPTHLNMDGRDSFSKIFGADLEEIIKQ